MTTVQTTTFNLPEITEIEVHASNAGPGAVKPYVLFLNGWEITELAKGLTALYRNRGYSEKVTLMRNNGVLKRPPLPRIRLTWDNKPVITNTGIKTSTSPKRGTDSPDPIIAATPRTLKIVTDDIIGAMSHNNSDGMGHTQLTESQKKEVQNQMYEEMKRRGIKV